MTILSPMFSLQFGSILAECDDTFNIHLTDVTPSTLVNSTVEITHPDILFRMTIDEKLRNRHRPSLDEYRHEHAGFIRTDDESYVPLWG